MFPSIYILTILALQEQGHTIGFEECEGLRHHTAHLVFISGKHTAKMSHCTRARMWNILPQPLDTDSLTAHMQRPTELSLHSVTNLSGSEEP